MHFLKTRTELGDSRSSMASVFSRCASLSPRRSKMFKQPLALAGSAILPQFEMRWRDFLTQLMPDLVYVHGQSSGIQTPQMLGLQTLGHGTQGHVLHQIDNVLGQGFARFCLVQADEWRPVAGPAAYQSLVAHGETEAAGHVAHQKRDICGCAVGTPSQRIKGVRNGQCGDSPFLGASVVSMQFQPQPPWQLTPSTLVFEDDHARVMNAAMQDRGNA